MNEREKLEDAIRTEHGGHWGRHPDFTVEDWQAEVSNNDTRLGYWDWVFDEMANRGLL